MAQSPPRLRDDLTITLLSGDDGGYVIEDPLRNVFFKIGRREYLFLCSLNRGDNLSKLPEDASIDDSDGQTVTREEALTILKWLGSKQLLQNQDVETLEAIESAEGAALQKNWLARMNLISFRIPLFNPDPFLCQIRPWLGWLAGPLFFAVWLLLAVVSLGALFVNWQSFINQSVMLAEDKHEACEEHLFDYKIIDNEIEIEINLQNSKLNYLSSTLTNTIATIITQIAKEQDLDVHLSGELFDYKNLSELTIEKLEDEDIKAILS